MVKKVLNYRVIITPEKYPDGSVVYNAYAPTLGVSDYGDSIEEVLKSIQDGIFLAIESMASKKEQIPVDQVEKEIMATASVNIPSSLSNKISFA
ncbi:hypothetical protein A3D77_02145 [Candidatus Gottesmanbacteria bacterium RIFCSPHIGHO2_02_FULL_39_11]|uniref:HicB-like antitoxin of toxin-antitoxin system domain-containing protein n=1 Tax=Candidatus Gottesmanbacteria bacterium RIFCSPHIGHO2_02_FULL_39_11 TaxID=1798382 RepID=A0A1F5ZUI9_9BACT|nr:MAG: hypothetical protein A3D77_02145 [Candidatus Gottesmanbacteria bacterium RIFCSPHIGHO2_02_FULL_39_11]